MKKLFFLLSIVVILQGCDAQNSKINGISFVAAGEAVTQENVTPVVNINANYAAIMPFGFIRDLQNPTLSFNTERQWFGERREGVKQYIEMLQQKDIKIMMKPQIWIWRGEFTGYLKMSSEKDWKALEASYMEFILLYAGLAQETNTEIMCIGTELEQFIVHRPDFWDELIVEVKKVYKGKLTYAANWDEYKRVPFWGKLDYIGIDAYFPLSEMQTPTLEDAKKGWQPWLIEMEQISEKNKKPILFTEYGYRSVDYAGKEPWKSDRSMTAVNLDAQSILMQSVFEELYPREWFAGGFIWKWFIAHDEVGGFDDTQFTPQNKPVERLLKEKFKQ